jgi:catechol 2,3-dioxygenase-like lactoylglutathione lyase family enzyme
LGGTCRSESTVPVSLDHLIVPVDDAAKTVAFWTRYLGVTHEGPDGPFEVLRVDATTIVQLAPHGTEGNRHYAFFLEPDEFDEAFARLRADGVPFGDAFDRVGHGEGPGRELGARGVGPTVYFFDPNHHLLEIRTRERSG